MTDQPTAPEGPATPDQPGQQGDLGQQPPPPVQVEPVEPFAPPTGAAGEPARHFDGQQWLVWNGTAWVPEGQPLAPPSSGPNRTRIVAIVVIVVALLVAGIFVASRVMNANKAIVIPTTLGGLQKATDPDVTAGADQFRQQTADALNGVKSDVGAYGSASAGQIALLVAARGGGTADDFFNGMKSSGADVSAVQTVGDAQCVVVTSEGVSACMRSSSTLFVAVLLSGTDTSKAASMVDEAWAAQ